MQDVIFILRFNVRMLDINVCVNLTKVSSFFKKYNLNIISHILTQHVNSLTAVIII